MINLIIFSVIVSLLIPVIKYIHYQKKIFCYQCQLPGPNQTPFIGYGFKMFKNKKFYDVILDLCSKFPTLFKIWCFNTLIVVVTDPKKCKTVLETCISKREEIRLLNPAVGNGLFSLTGHKWTERRKLLKNSFNLSILNNYVNIFQTYSQNFILTLQENANKEVDVYPLLRFNNFSLIIESCLGFKLDLERKRIFLNNYLEIEKLFETRRLNPFMNSDWLWFLTLNYRKTKSLSDDLKCFSKIIIDYYKNNEIKPQNFLGHLLDLVNEKKLTEETDVINEIQSIIASGTDTTTITISTAMVMLGMHQEVQSKLRDEILEIVTSKEQELTIDLLNQMTYLQCVVSETLRLFPPGEIIVRKTTENITIDKFVIPNGTTIIIPIEHLHCDPKVWTDSKSFQPERFMSENFSNQKQDSFLPFGHTPRSCLGDKFAMTVIKMFLCDVLRNFKVTECQYASMTQIEMKWSSNVRELKHGYIVKLKPLRKQMQVTKCLPQLF